MTSVFEIVGSLVVSFYVIAIKDAAIDYDEHADVGGGEDGNGREQGRENGRGTGRGADGLTQQPRDGPSPELTQRANTTNPLCRQMSTREYCHSQLQSTVNIGRFECILLLKK